MFAFYSGQPSPQYLFSKTQIIPAKRVILTRVFSRAFTGAAHFPIAIGTPGGYDLGLYKK